MAPVALVMSWSRGFAIGRKTATPTFVDAKRRIPRWKALASSNDRFGMVSFAPKLNAHEPYS